MAVDAGLVEVADEEAGTVTAGEELSRITGGSPRDVLGVWLAALESVLADASVPDLGSLIDAMAEGEGELDLSAVDWDPEAEAEFLDGVLANLYLLTVGEDAPGDAPVPLPALAASVLVPDGMEEPSNAVLERVSEAMMKLDDQFRLLEPVGLVAYRPVDEELADVRHRRGARAARRRHRRGPLRHGAAHPARPVRAAGPAAGGRVRRAGRRGPRRQGRRRAARRHRRVPGGYRARRDRALAGPPGAAGRRPGAAGRGARHARARAGSAAQQALALVGAEAEPALREVLGDPELGGLARVWLTEHGAGDMPAPSEAMIFWLTVDTVAAQLAAEGNSEELRALVEGLAAQHSGLLRHRLAGRPPRHRGRPGGDGAAAPRQEGGQGGPQGGVQGAVATRGLTWGAPGGGGVSWAVPRVRRVLWIAGPGGYSRGRTRR
ncbi:putative protein OS=Streptomyces fumanus OX=67302 GN=GCM10018772_65170 PE=4 SV=1 [Streptomyces fumanus]